jgi:polyisoprenoid-binding protein YceI
MSALLKTAVLAGVAALAAAAAGAQSTQSNPSLVPGGAYRVEPGHTRVLFSLSHMGFSTWYGDFTGVSGSLTLDPKHPARSQLDVSVPVASISTTNAKLDDELRSPTWLDAGKYPTMTFHSTRVLVTGPGKADVFGALTLHGVTKPVVLHARFKGAGTNPMDKGYTVGFDVTGKIKRSDFGVSSYVPLIGDEVDLIISAPFEHKAP